MMSSDRGQDVSDFPKMAQPAKTALLHAGYHQLKDLTQATEGEIKALHGMGPKAMKTLKSALAERGLAFKSVTSN